jgi:arylsulfatase A-like enzyme
MFFLLLLLDYNIGVLLDTLDDLGVTNDTAVLVMGDHGYQSNPRTNVPPVV